MYKCENDWKGSTSYNDPFILKKYPQLPFHELCPSNTVNLHPGPSWLPLYLWIFTRRAWPRGLPWPWIKAGRWTTTPTFQNLAGYNGTPEIRPMNTNSLITGGFFLAACSFTWASLSRRGNSHCGIETVIHDYRVVVVWFFWFRKKIINASSTSCEENQPHLPTRTVRIRWFLEKKQTEFGSCWGPTYLELFFYLKHWDHCHPLNINGLPPRTWANTRHIMSYHVKRCPI